MQQSHSLRPSRQLFLLVFLLIWLTACSNAAESGTATANPVPPSRTPTQRLPTSTPLPEPTSQPTNEPTSQPTTQPTAESTTDTDLPAPTLFTTAWDDATPYQAGLRTGESEIAGQLNNAPIYHLDFSIDDSLTVIIGQQEIRYTNREDVAFNELNFHLFPNLLGEAITVENVRVNATAVSPRLLDNDTILQVPLPDPLQPGQQVMIALDFITDVPTESGRNYGIIAYVDNVLALAHFYPQLAVYDDEGWNIAAPPEAGDVVYADAGFYLVRVTAPADQVLVASGTAVAEEPSGNTTTFAIGPARDFYLASSNEYIATSQTVDGITVNSYAPLSLAEGSALVLDYAVEALQIYSAAFGPYPYTELDIAATPTLALGVEYPGLFVNTNRIYDLTSDLGGVPAQIYLESTTAHEMGHQWFYNLVGNDQLDEPWLDEALAQYATWVYYKERYGSDAADSFYQSFESRWARLDQQEIPIGQPVGAYPGAAYSAIIYGRGPIFVRELARAMGEDNFASFIQDYTMTFSWQTATTADFQRLAEQHCNCDLSDLFAAWVY